MAATQQAAFRRIRSLILTCCALLILAAPLPLAADDTYWQHDPATPGDWFDPANWDNGVPGEDDAAYVDNGGTAQIASGDAEFYSLFVGQLDSGTVTQSGDQGASGRYLYLADGPGSQGTYELGGGSLVTYFETIGKWGTGLFLHAAGTHTLTNRIYLGGDDGHSSAVGRYELSGSGVLSTPLLYVGNYGTGQFVQTGGVNETGWLYLASGSYSSGTYELYAGQLVTDGETIGMASEGLFVHTGGTHTVTGTLTLGDSGGHLGTYRLSGTGVLSAQTLHVGESSAEGRFEQTGGTGVAEEIYVGYYGGAQGHCTLGGGSLSASILHIGYSGGRGQFEQTGGTCEVGHMASDAGSTYAISGGVLRVSDGALLDGQFHMNHGPWELRVDGGIVDVGSVTVHDASEATFTSAAGTLTIFPAGMDPASAFGSWNAQGLVHEAGTPLTVPAGVAVTGWGRLTDPVVNEGTLTATQGEDLDLLAGIDMRGGAVSLGAESVVSIEGTGSGMSGGEFSAFWMRIGEEGHSGRFVHTAGTATITAMALGSGSGSEGSYELSGTGHLYAGGTWAGSGGTASVVQTGGFWESQSFYLGCEGSQATYRLEGGEFLCSRLRLTDTWGVSSEFVQTGGVSTVTREFIITSPSGASGVYRLQGGELDAVELRVAGEGTVLFEQTGGTLGADYLCVGYASRPGLFQQTGGSCTVHEWLTVGPQGRLEYTVGSLSVSNVHSEGVVELGGAPVTVNVAEGATANFSGGTFAGHGAASYVAGERSLSIFPAGFDPHTEFGSYTSSGVTHVMGTGPLTIPADCSAMLKDAFAEHVVCAGSLAPYPDPDSNPVIVLDLTAGVEVLGAGRVDLGVEGDLTVKNTVSGISDDGSLTARDMVVGCEGAPGVFTQSGGTNTLLDELTLGRDGVAGTYNLGGDGRLEAQEGDIGDGGDGRFVQNGGTATFTTALEIGLQGSCTGRYELTGDGELAAPVIKVGTWNEGTFVQSAGTVAADYLTVGLHGRGLYELSGTGGLEAEGVRVGYGADGTFRQTGGTASATDLTLGEGGGHEGTLELSGGTFSANCASVGEGGTGHVIHAAGILEVAEAMTLGSSNGCDGTYDLSGTGELRGGAIRVGDEGQGLFRQTGGTAAPAHAVVGGTGRYEFTGGTFAAHGLHLGGPFDFLGADMDLAWDDMMLSAGTGDFVNGSDVSLALGPHCLVVLPPGKTVGENLESFTHAGLTHTLGSTLVIPADRTIVSSGTIADRVECYGSLTSGTPGILNLADGLSLAGGTVDLGEGALTVNDLTSGMTGGSLAVHDLCLGDNAEGRFVQSGGTHTVRGTAYVGDHDPGTYEIGPNARLVCETLRVGYYGDGTFLQTGGVVEVTGIFWRGWKHTSNSGDYAISAGEFIADETYMGRGTFRQTGGTVRVNGLRVGWCGDGSYALEGGDLIADSAYVGHALSTGQFTQTGGRFTVAADLTLGIDKSGVRGVYDLLGGNVSADEVRVGYRKPGTFNQTDGNVEARLLSMGTYAGADGVYNLSGGGTLEADAEFVGLEGTAAFNQSGGSNTTAYLSVGAGGRYEYTGGALEVGGGLKVAGEFDAGDQAWAIDAETFILNFAGGTVQRAGNVSVNLATKALTIIPEGFDPGSAVGSYATAGMTHVAGNTLVVPVGSGFGGSGEIDDPVQCAGEIVAGPGNFIDLRGGLTVADGGTVDLGWGTLAVNQGTSSVGAATLTVGTLAVGEDGPATFSITHRAARVTVSQALRLGPEGAIDVTTAGLAVLYEGESPFDGIHANVASGCNGGAWDGFGINSSAAAAQPQGLAALGVIDDGEKVIVDYTWAGDANLDGIVDSNDYDRIDTAWVLWTREGRVPEGGFRWAVGDFDYDNTIDSNDYDLIDRAYVFSEGAPLGGGAATPTPEPASAALLLAGLALAARCLQRGPRPT